MKFKSYKGHVDPLKNAQKQINKIIKKLEAGMTSEQFKYKMEQSANHEDLMFINIDDLYVHYKKIVKTD